MIKVEPRSSQLLLILFCILFMEACSLDRIAVRSSTSILKNTVLAINEEEDPVIAEKAIASQLKMLEGMIKSDPQNQELLLIATKGFCSYAFSFVEDSDKNRAKIFYKRGLDYGLKMLTINSRFSKALEKGGDHFNNALKDIDNSNLPPLFWTAYCWGSLINLNRNSPEALIALPKVKQMMKRSLELNDSYYFGGAHLFFGIMYGSMPPILGGKPDKSREHFEKALKIAQGKFLMTRTLYAKTYAVGTQNKDLFVKLLEEVLNSPSEMLPSQRLANKLAKIKAKKLLQDINEYF